MTDAKKSGRETVSTKIREIAKRSGVTFPPSLVDEMATKLSGLKVTPAEFTKVISEVTRRFRHAEVDAHESVGIIAADSPRGWLRRRASLITAPGKRRAT